MIGHIRCFPQSTDYAVNDNAKRTSLGLQVQRALALELAGEDAEEKRTFRSNSLTEPDPFCGLIWLGEQPGGAGCGGAPCHPCNAVEIPNSSAATRTIMGSPQRTPRLLCSAKKDLRTPGDSASCLKCQRRLVPGSGLPSVLLGVVFVSSFWPENSSLFFNNIVPAVGWWVG